ncbi:MarR family winged helix-turn-helix transcriptional regulator [Deinococcus hopiensis]|uniref:MarR family winged helix-turn-helix transcriptional regulator n=1 Tax=Deinococcus hopiensis TaxID=309885 RepID=UPI001483C190|nr:MarR family winged helix-turn-helix transcriptional regulator [Deinococcus hopiensis]
MNASPTLDPLAFMRRVGRLYRLLHETIHPDLERALGLQPKEVQVLAAVADGHHSPTVISRRVGAPAPSTSRFIDQLVTSGLLERHAHPGDLRRFQLRLTPQGEATLREARTLARTALTRRFEAIPPADLEGAEQSLMVLEGHFNPGEDL